MANGWGSVRPPLIHDYTKGMRGRGGLGGLQQAREDRRSDIVDIRNLLGLTQQMSNIAKTKRHESEEQYLRDLVAKEGTMAAIDKTKGKKFSVKGETLVQDPNGKSISFRALETVRNHYGKRIAQEMTVLNSAMSQSETMPPEAVSEIKDRMRQNMYFLTGKKGVLVTSTPSGWAFTLSSSEIEQLLKNDPEIFNNPLAKNFGGKLNPEELAKLRNQLVRGGLDEKNIGKSPNGLYVIQRTLETSIGENGEEQTFWGVNVENPYTVSGMKNILKFQGGADLLAEIDMFEGKDSGKMLQNQLAYRDVLETKLNLRIALGPEVVDKADVLGRAAAGGNLALQQMIAKEMAGVGEKSLRNDFPDQWASTLKDLRQKEDQGSLTIIEQKDLRTLEKEKKDWNEAFNSDDVNEGTNLLFKQIDRINNMISAQIEHYERIGKPLPSALEHEKPRIVSWIAAGKSAKTARERKSDNALTKRAKDMEEQTIGIAQRYKDMTSHKKRTQEEKRAEIDEAFDTVSGVVPPSGQSPVPPSVGEFSPEQQRILDKLDPTLRRKIQSQMEEKQRKAVLSHARTYEQTVWPGIVEGATDLWKSTQLPSLEGDPHFEQSKKDHKILTGEELTEDEYRKTYGVSRSYKKPSRVKTPSERYQLDPLIGSPPKSDLFDLKTSKVESFYEAPKSDRVTPLKLNEWVSENLSGINTEEFSSQDILDTKKQYLNYLKDFKAKRSRGTTYLGPGQVKAPNIDIF